MITDEIYKDVLKAVESEIELHDGWITGSKTEDATDARYILCGFLHQQGLSSSQIQQMTGLKKSTVNKILSGVRERMERRKMAKIWWLLIERKLNAKGNGKEGLCDYLCG